MAVLAKLWPRLLRLGPAGRGRAGRLDVLLLWVAVGLAVLTSRLAYLQLWRGADYEALARANAFREVHSPAPRGRILDRHGELLAGSRPALTALLSYPGAEEFSRRLPVLARATGVAPAEIEAAVRRRSGLLFAPVIITEDLDAGIYTRLAERALEYPELRLGWQPAREYPLGPAAAHVLGYLGEVSPEDMAAYPDVYGLGDTRGLDGVEAACDWLLRGQPERATYEVDATGGLVRVVGTREGRPGQDVRLTLDARLQEVAFERLGEAMARARRESKGRCAATGGAAVALDVTTGAVLALVSRPSFDPAVFASPSSAAAAEPLTRDPSAPLLNRAAAGLFPPGSVFKLVTATAALETGAVRPDTAFTDRGQHWLYAKKCWRPGGHGRVTLENALAWSCNVYFYEAGLRVGADRLAAYARRLGLGWPTGFDLLSPHGPFGPGRTGPGRDSTEPSGILPTPAYKARHFPDDPTFWPAEVMDAAIGQGFSAYTPLQVAVAVAGIANGGTRWRPYVVEAVLDETGRVVARAEPEALTPAPADPPVSEATFAAVREGMRAAAMRPDGTAGAVFGPGFRARWGVEVAGKTGTAEHGAGSGLADDAWFVAFVPYDKPRLVVVVLIEQGGSGSRAAAPVARAVIEAWLAEERGSP